MESNIVLATAYFAPVQYYSKFMTGKAIVLEQHENYRRQSYRNRCIILGANGKIKLSIPVIKKQKQKTLIRDIKIDYSTNWQKNHERGIMSAYRSSPFFEFYIDDYLFIFQKKEKYLFDLNWKILTILMDQIGLCNTLSTSEKYTCEPGEYDYREIISPKKELHYDREFRDITYRQVFAEKHSFVSNLSIIDLLFNTGPEAIEILKQSIKI